jgi:hypothetical protein
MSLLVLALTNMQPSQLLDVGKPVKYLKYSIYRVTNTGWYLCRQVGGGYVPWSSFGNVPDTDLLKFSAKATAGGLLSAEDCINLPAPFPDRYRFHQV